MQLIADDENLLNICEKLAKCDFIAVDTEFLCTKTYYPIFCLLQISMKDENFIIDPTKVDLNILNPIWENEKIVKVFHAAHKDLEIIQHVCRVKIKNIFDTQIASMLCYYDIHIPSYQTLVYKLLKKKLDKKQQMTAWNQRPLTEKQLEYAANDVIFLVQIYEKLQKIIEKQGKNDILKILMTEKNFVKTIDLERMWQKLCTEENLEHVDFLREMIYWRERKAKQENVNRNLVFNDQELLSMVKIAELDENSPIIKKKKFKKDILEKITELRKQDLQNSTDFQPKNNQLYKQYDKRLISFFDIIIDFLCEEVQISKSIVANRKDIIDFLYKKKGKLTQGWIHEKFGKKITAFEQNRGKILLQGRKISIVN